MEGMRTKEGSVGERGKDRGENPGLMVRLVASSLRRLERLLVSSAFESDVGTVLSA